MRQRFKQALGNWRLLIPILLLAVGFLIGGKYGLEYWMYTITHVYTDDARIKGTMVSISPEVSGVVRRIYVDEGGRVKKGMILAEIDQAEYQTQRAQAEASLEAVRTQLAEAQRELAWQIQRHTGEVAHAQALLDAQQSKLHAAEAGLIQTYDHNRHALIAANDSDNASAARFEAIEHALTAAAGDIEYARRLCTEGGEPSQVPHLGAMASEKMDRLQTHRMNMLRAEVQEAETAYKLVLADEGLVDVKRTRIKLLEAKLKEEEAKVAAARLRLEGTVLRSPIDGVVSRKRVEYGEMVQRGQPILVVNDPHDIWVLANVKETSIRHVQIGSPVDVWIDAYPHQSFRGLVKSIGATAISEFALFPPTGNFTKVEQRIPVRITLEHPEGLLKPGMMAIVGIEIPRGGKEQRETATQTSSAVH